MPEPGSISHVDLALQIARIEGCVNTITLLLGERNKSHEALAMSHKELSDDVGKLKERMAQICIVGFILSIAMPYIFDQLKGSKPAGNNRSAIISSELQREKG